MNDSIRRAAKEAGVPLWMVAHIAGISEATLIRWMRVPLKKEKEDMLLDAIKRSQTKGD